MMGDFNEVRYKSDRFGSVFNAQGADEFNSFIVTAGLVEVQLGGSAFTWCHKSATKMSKLDRFFISENLLTKCPHVSAITLERYLSDHRPILLREASYDYGPVPFRFFHHWLELDGFSTFVTEQWNIAPVNMSNGLCNLMGKLKFIKTRIREWLKCNNQCNIDAIVKYKEDIRLLDAAIDNGKGSDKVVAKRMEVFNDLQRIEKLHSMDLSQKAKIKWSIEGDENSRFFHGVLNKKRNQMNVRGVMVDGVWREQPINVKREFYNHFCNRFDKPPEQRAIVDMIFPNSLSPEQQVELECEVTKDELKQAVWDCGSDKSPGPDGFSFGFYRDIVSDVQSAFIKGRQILDDAFILNEVTQWFKSKKKQSLIFKVDFEKAFDSVRWDFLDDVLKKFGFRNKWWEWIQKCLKSSCGSILINGSPTEEFQFFKGLKQGDPQSPFLFILVMECLHLYFQKVVDAGMFMGIRLSQSINLSHMFYADDAVFVRQWNDKNINTLTHVLECFYHASGLRINMSQSTKVGGIMSRSEAWNEVIEKVKSWLSKWKMKALSIGGRLTLLKSVLGSIPIFYMSIFRAPSSVLHKLESIRYQFFNGHEFGSRKASWVKWKYVLADKVNGGLGVSSLFALNRGLMIKWLWKFYDQKNSLWLNVIKAIHGNDGNVGLVHKNGVRSCWITIVNEVKELQKQCVNVLDCMRLKLGNGESASFWNDNWSGVGAAKDLYPRLFALENHNEVSVSSKLTDLCLDRLFRRSARVGVEQVQFDTLVTLVSKVNLVPMDTDGFGLWRARGISRWLLFAKLLMRIVLIQINPRHDGLNMSLLRQTC
nr:RNA-directed DNA polymerase, eukaryota, reverse transcriptase zinc-binding domain protein [Tanacetum cinerariifolium]